MSEDKKAEYQESNKFGTLRVLSVVKMFIERGFIVSIPSMTTRYDFIAEMYPALIRVQVKNLSLKKDETENESSHKLWCIRSYSSPRGEKRTYSIEDCDMIVGICLDSGTFAIVPISEIGGKTEFRLSTHKDSKGREYLNSCKALDDFCKPLRA